MIQKTRKGGVQKKIGVRWTSRGREQGELLQIVPGGRVHPGKLRFGGLGADETGRVGDAKGTDSTDVSKEGMINGRRNKSMVYGLIELGGGGQENTVRSFKTKVVEVWGDRGRASLNENVVLGAKRFKNSDCESETRVDDLGSGEPN